MGYVGSAYRAGFTVPFDVLFFISPCSVGKVTSQNWSGAATSQQGGRRLHKMPKREKKHNLGLVLPLCLVCIRGVSPRDTYGELKA